MGRDHGSAAKCCATTSNREGNDLRTHRSMDGVDDIVRKTINGGPVAPALLFVPVQVRLPGLSQHGPVLGWQAIQRPVRGYVLTNYLLGSDRHPDPGQGQEDIPSVSLK